MALSKLAISLIASSIGVVAIGATVTGVVVSRQNDVQTIDTNGEETSSKPTKPVDSSHEQKLRADKNSSIQIDKQIQLQNLVKK